MSDINELNEKIAELKKQRDALAEKTGGFKVGDKVVIEGVISVIEVNWNNPLKVKMGGGEYGYFRPDHLRHADAAPDAEPVCWANFYGFGGGGVRGCTHGSKESAERTGLYSATEIAVPLYRTPPDASKRIAELEKQAADKQAHILHLEGKLSAQRKVKAGLHQAICDRNERIAELEADVESWKEKWRLEYAENQDLRDMLRGKNARIDLLQDWLAKASAFKSKPTCDTTCDSPDKCCNTKPAEPAPTVDDGCDSVDVAPKSVKDAINHILDGIRFGGWVDDPSAIAYISKGMVDGIRDALSEIVELPEPNKYVAIRESSCGGFDVLMDNHFWFFVNSHNALPLAAALIKAAQKAEAAQ